VEAILDPDPVVQFRQWFESAMEAGIPQANAMVLATASPDGRPSARVVLLKRYDDHGFQFFTSYESPKARDLDSNARAALVFYWEDLGRQVRVEGSVERLPTADSDVYFASRPFEHQISTLVSPQSTEITREELDRRFEALRVRFTGKVIPRPTWWGGYRVVPARFEFWQRRFARLNDRVVYQRRGDGSWRIARLAA
jgi:pyridoxamine 5'-phosphate oxidase